jgi:hypothetical protein
MFDDDEIRKAQEEERRSPGQKSKTEKVEKKLLAEVRRAFDLAQNANLCRLCGRSIFPTSRRSSPSS